MWRKNPFLMPWYPNNMHNVKLITHPLAPTFSTFNDNALPTSSIWLHLHHVLHRLYACDLCAQSNVKGHPPTRDVSVGISTFIWTFYSTNYTNTKWPANEKQGESEQQLWRGWSNTISIMTCENFEWLRIKLGSIQSSHTCCIIGYDYENICYNSAFWDRETPEQTSYVPPYDRSTTV